MDTVFIKKNYNHRVNSGHPWVFSNELVEIPKLEAGALVKVKDYSRSNSYGYGFYNPNSLIAVRLLFYNSDINNDFFINRISNANQLRQNIFPNSSFYRMVFGESDFLPGLIIDRIEDYFAIQILSVGMEIRKELIINTLLDIFPQCKGIIEKNFSQHRLSENLEQAENIVFGTIPDYILTEENSIKLSIQLKNSQKTGYYLDQRINRLAIKQYAKNMHVLDCYTNQGGFALNCACGLASSVTAIDSSELAINLAKHNAVLNSYQNIDFIEADVEDFLSSEKQNNKKYNIIILDPPAFAKNKKTLPQAKIKYAKLHKFAFRLLENNSLLATSSCSHHLSEIDFLNLITKEAALQKKQLKIIYRGMQSLDHPVLCSMPETQYLKYFIFQVI